MTALEKAFAKATDLPKPLQKQLAEQLVADIEGELRWDQTLAKSQPLLEQLAQAARRAHETGATHRKGFDDL